MPAKRMERWLVKETVKDGRKLSRLSNSHGQHPRDVCVRKGRKEEKEEHRISAVQRCYYGARPPVDWGPPLGAGVWMCARPLSPARAGELVKRKGKRRTRALAHQKKVGPPVHFDKATHTSSLAITRFHFATADSPSKVAFASSNLPKSTRTEAGLMPGLSWPLLS